MQICLLWKTRLQRLKNMLSIVPTHLHHCIYRRSEYTYFIQIYTQITWCVCDCVYSSYTKLPAHASCMNVTDGSLYQRWVMQDNRLRVYVHASYVRLSLSPSLSQTINHTAIFIFIQNVITNQILYAADSLIWKCFLD